MNGHFDRNGNEIDLMQWSRLLNTNYQRVAFESLIDLAHPDITYDVSTVWLGLDHRFTGEGPPIIFETMIFGPGPLDETTRRYATEQQALEGHQQMVDIARADMVDPLAVRSATFRQPTRDAVRTERED